MAQARSTLQRPQPLSSRNPMGLRLSCRRGTLTLRCRGCSTLCVRSKKALQAMQLKQAAAERLAESLRQELAQEQADKVELSQRLQYLEAEAQGSAHLQSTNRNLQEQV